MGRENWKLVRYEATKRREWDDFVAASRNGTFLLMRDYMDYHADRFADCSWMAYKGNRLLAILPANITADGILHSHQGLTYGGWILPPAHLDGADLLEIWDVAIDEWKKRGVKMLNYKPIPSIYHRQPSEEDLYALFRLGATQTQCGLSAAVNLREPWKFNTLQNRHLAKTRGLSLSIRETERVEAFMNLLAECLRERHDVSPVHSAEELRLLKSRFPENIRIFAVSLVGEGDSIDSDELPMEAAVCIYDTGRVAHAQYIATSRKGRELNLLAPLFYYLFTQVFDKREYFDFGISTEEGGRYLNEGLLRQKYSYGATGVVYSRFSIPIF